MNCHLLRDIGFTLTLFFVSFFWTISHCHADSVIQIDSDKQFEFAETCFLNHDYLQAVHEYKRFIYFFPRDQRVESAMYSIGMSMFSANRFTRAIHAFNKVIEKYRHTLFSIKSYFMITESFMRQNEPGQALININNLIQITMDKNTLDQAYYNAGWICIKMGQRQKAEACFKKISSEKQARFGLKQLSEELEKAAHIPQKSPGLAGLLSIIPGAGQLYCERYQDALIAFILNTALIYAAYEAFDDDKIGFGSVITIVEFGFYAGNIYGSVNSAHKYNRSGTSIFIENLQKNMKINLSGGFQPDTQEREIVLAFESAF